MSIYLSNNDVGPVGAEPGEFIDFPLTMAEILDQRGERPTPREDDTPPSGESEQP